MKILLLILALPAVALAQLDDPAWLATATKPVADGGSFSPSSVTGYALDYDVDALGLSDGTLVSTLTDQGPDNYSLLSSGTERPYWTNDSGTINGKGFIVFSGSGNVMQTNFDFTVTQPCTHFVVATYPQVQVTAVYGRMFDGGYNGAWGVLGRNNANRYTGGSDVVSYESGTVANSTVADSNWLLYEFKFNGASSSVFTNGVQCATGDAGTEGLHGYTLGADREKNLAAFSFKGHIARVIIFSGTISAGDLTAIRNYLKATYSLW